VKNYKEPQQAIFNEDDGNDDDFDRNKLLAEEAVQDRNSNLCYSYL